MRNMPVVMSQTRQHTHLKLTSWTNIPLNTTQQARRWQHRTLTNYVATAKQTNTHMYHTVLVTLAVFFFTWLWALSKSYQHNASCSSSTCCYRKTKLMTLMLNNLPPRTFFTSELERLEVFEDLLPVAVPDIYPGSCWAIISDRWRTTRHCRAARCSGHIHRGCVLLLTLVFVFLLVFTPSTSSIIHGISVELSWPFLRLNWWVV